MSVAKKIKKQTSFDKAAEVASFYGFLHAPDLTVTGIDNKKGSLFKDAKKTLIGEVVEEKIALTRGIIDKSYADLPQPLMLFYGGPRGESQYHTFNIDISGSPQSISDALIIETCYVIAKEAYPEYELSVLVNTVGDKESSQKFVRDFQNFVKKHGAHIPPSIKQLIKKDPYEYWGEVTKMGHDQLFASQNINTATKDSKESTAAKNTKKAEDKFNNIKMQAPTPMGSLSEPSRKHFKEVLEYIEVLKIPFNFEHSIVGAKGFTNETVFHIEGIKKQAHKNEHKKIILAYGARYNGLTRKAWGKKDIASMFGLVMLPEACKKNLLVSVPSTNGNSDSSKQLSTTKQGAHSKSKPTCPNASFFFMQLSFDAKLKSLRVLELLRQAGIPVQQSLSKDKITGQIEQAEKCGTTHLIIMGKKEAMEDAVCIRDMQTRVQITVSISELTKYIAKLLK